METWGVELFHRAPGSLQTFLCMSILRHGHCLSELANLLKYLLHLFPVAPLLIRLSN